MKTRIALLVKFVALVVALIIIPALLALVSSAATNRTYYARHIGGGRFSSALYAEPATNHYPYVSTAPVTTNASVYCRGFRWLVEGESATGVYEVTPLPPPEPSTNVIYSVDILASIGAIVGAERYAEIKQALAATPVDGAPAFDLLSSAMYIPSEDPRLAAARDALIAAGLLTREEYDAIIERATSDEPTARGAAAAS